MVEEAETHIAPPQTDASGSALAGHTSIGGGNGSGSSSGAQISAQTSKEETSSSNPNDGNGTASSSSTQRKPKAAKSKARSEAAKKATAIRKQKLKEREEAMASFMDAWNSAKQEAEEGGGGGGAGAGGAGTGTGGEAPEHDSGTGSNQSLSRPGEPGYPSGPASTDPVSTLPDAGSDSLGNPSEAGGRVASVHGAEDVGVGGESSRRRGMLSRFSRGRSRLLQGVVSRGMAAVGSGVRPPNAARPMSFMTPARRAQALMTTQRRGPREGSGVRTLQ